MTVRDVAKRIGVSFPYVSDIERGEANVTIDVVERYAGLVGVTITAASSPPASSALGRALAALAALPATALDFEVEMLERRAARERVMSAKGTA